MSRDITFLSSDESNPRDGHRSGEVLELVLPEVVQPVIDH
jgi:hypothetical protein